MNPKKGSILLSFFLLFWALGVTAQINNSGKPGIIFIPSAIASEEGEFRLGYTYVPINYALRARGRTPERVVYANITIFKRLEINANILQRISTEKHKVKDGIGDRQLDLRYLILKEKKNIPSLAVILTTPFTIDGAMLTHALVATKNFKLGRDFKLEASLGYGSPYYLYRDVKNLENSNFLSGFVWQKKSEDEFENDYLLGAFGGAVLHYKNVGGVMAEWDSKHVNVGAYARLFKVWTIQAGLLDGKQLTAGTSVAINLLKPSRRLKQQADAKN